MRLHLVGTAGGGGATWPGGMDLDRGPDRALFLKRGHQPAAEVVRVPVPPSGHAFDVPRQTEAFLAAIRGEHGQLASAADGRASVALCLAVENALGSGARVVLNRT